MTKNIPPTDPLEGTKLILASASPRRRDLLSDCGYQFTIHPASEDAECGICSGETPPEYVARMAFQKTEDVAKQLESPAATGIILGCDTVAECLGQVLGKPEHREHAKQMLTLLRGREHRVYSGVCLWRQSDNHHIIRVDTTTLEMKKITDSQLDEYLDSQQWQGKAGAFGYQDRHDWLQIIQGSESNVVGLPLELLAQMFTELR